MQNEETEKGEWVNFSSSSEVRPTYVYPCNFCRRKFYSSQALGGHQNAHKRERGLLRHYRIPIVPRSLGPHPHSDSIPPHQSLLTDITGPVATYSERCTSFRSGWQQQQPTAAMWPGSFGFGDQRSWPGEIQREDELDLELKL